MYDLKDKVAVVTGASNGIGASFVREILEEGVKVRLFTFYSSLASTRGFIRVPVG